jgi:RNA polymerase sigma-70 factor (ECF subfamily)
LAPFSSELDEIRRASVGDRAAQKALVHRHMPVIYRISFRVLRDKAEAEDITQETFLRAWKMLPDWEPRAKFSTWACGVALNLCRDRLRRKKAILVDVLPECADPAPHPEAQLAMNQTVERIAGHIAALPPRQREALTLCAFEGLGNKEAAVAMSISVHALEGLLGRARRSLKAVLQKDIMP